MVVITVRKIIFIPDSIRVEDPPPRGLPHQPGWPPSFPQPHGPPARVLTACWALWPPQASKPPSLGVLRGAGGEGMNLEVANFTLLTWRAFITSFSRCFSVPRPVPLTLFHWNILSFLQKYKILDATSPKWVLQTPDIQEELSLLLLDEIRFSQFLKRSVLLWAMWKVCIKLITKMLL